MKSEAITEDDDEMPYDINNTTKIANSTLAFLRRNIRSSPPDAKGVKAKTYNNNVRPRVEYASSVWSPAADSHILASKSFV
jgi:hypothetical protein